MWIKQGELTTIQWFIRYSDSCSETNRWLRQFTFGQDKIRLLLAVNNCILKFGMSQFRKWVILGTGGWEPQTMAGGMSETTVEWDRQRMRALPPEDKASIKPRRPLMEGHDKQETSLEDVQTIDFKIELIYIHIINTHQIFVLHNINLHER